MSSANQIAEHYTDRGKRARQLREAGQKVIGYFCCFVPDEIIAAFDMVPYRIQGCPAEPIDRADAFIEPMACPFARSCFNMAVKGSYDFLDGFVAPHSCDTVERLYQIWRHNVPADFNHFLNVPHMMGPSSDAFYRKELEFFISALEEWSGKKLDEEKLKQTVRLYNLRRARLRELYALRKPNPPLISGVEITELIVAGMGMPASEHIELIDKTIVDVIRRPQPKGPKQPRIFLWGNEIDDTAFVKLVEESGAYIVMDDLCTGSRIFWDDVQETIDPLDGIVSRYLHIHCPRSYMPAGDTREADLENRFGYIGSFIRQWRADGVIFYIIRYCDTCELDGPDLREYLNATGVPVLMIEDDYSTATMGQLRTRVQAFLEMIE